MIGTVEVTIRIRFNQDVTKQEVRNFIDEMDYEIKDTIGNVSIVDTEVISDDLDDRHAQAETSERSGDSSPAPCSACQGQGSVQVVGHYRGTCTVCKGTGKQNAKGETQT